MLSIERFKKFFTGSFDIYQKVITQYDEIHSDLKEMIFNLFEYYHSLPPSLMNFDVETSISILEALYNSLEEITSLIHEHETHFRYFKDLEYYDINKFDFHSFMNNRNCLQQFRNSYFRENFYDCISLMRFDHYSIQHYYSIQHHFEKLISELDDCVFIILEINERALHYLKETHSLLYSVCPPNES